jgi:hypothetical protein
MRPSTGCRGAFAQAVAAGPKRNLGPLWARVVCSESYFALPYSARGPHSARQLGGGKGQMPSAVGYQVGGAGSPATPVHAP